MTVYGSPVSRTTPISSWCYLDPYGSGTPTYPLTGTTQDCVLIILLLKRTRQRCQSRNHFQRFQVVRSKGISGDVPKTWISSFLMPSRKHFTRQTLSIHHTSPGFVPVSSLARLLFAHTRQLNCLFLSSKLSNTVSTDLWGSHEVFQSSSGA
ncbi:hypothetical protein BDP27DRAFT_1371661 [Rhodocollybia butyracea]|uniref:Uncharacterized protein n=1 Tax=Rhodocollybia butyracea TaxID=206335 RepID=A0A9P5TZA7_9AGAR|nr:hypothetical protein BDP27DRAFT_1371661 [Rhodocollybia butyracea]